MRSWKAAAAAGTLSFALLAVPSVAQAQHLRVTDPRGDTAVAGLDITSARFANREHAVVVRVTFARDRPGNVIVFVKTRHRPATIVISEHRRRGPDATYLPGGGCKGLTSHWRRAAAELTLRLPSRCLSAGNYGAVKAFVLIEGRGDGGDVDYAPQKPNGDLTYTPWIPRG